MTTPKSVQSSTQQSKGLSTFEKKRNSGTLVTKLTTQLNNLNKLEEVRLPYTLKTIASDAFSGCTKLKSVTVPAKVTNVNPHPFYGSGIENVYVDRFNADFKSRDGMLFDVNNTLISYPNGRPASEEIFRGWNLKEYDRPCHPSEYLR